MIWLYIRTSTTALSLIKSYCYPQISLDVCLTRCQLSDRKGICPKRSLSSCLLHLIYFQSDEITDHSNYLQQRRGKCPWLNLLHFPCRCQFLVMGRSIKQMHSFTWKSTDTSSSSSLLSLSKGVWINLKKHIYINKDTEVCCSHIWTFFKSFQWRFLGRPYTLQLW